MHTHDQSPGTLTDNYPQEHTRCLPPKAIARLGKGGVSAVTTSPDATLIAVLARIGVWLYDAHTDDFVALIAVEGTGVLGKIAFSPDGTQIAVGDWDGKTTLWSIETGAMLNTFTHQAHVASLAFSPDGRLLATGSRDRTAKLWDVETGTVRATMPDENGVPHIAFSPNGRFLATSSQDRSATLWSVETGENCWTVTYERSVESIAFSPDIRYVVIFWQLAGGIEPSHSGM